MLNQLDGVEQKETLEQNAAVFFYKLYTWHFVLNLIKELIKNLNASMTAK